MPPKKPAADSAVAPAPSSGDAPVEEQVEAKSDAAVVRKIATHPSTFIMVKEALNELDSRKGVSSQAIQNYIKQTYPSVDLVRLKHFVRRALKKGIETGTLVRPANSSVATGAMGKFRLAPIVKKSKTENTDPNVQKAPKPVKDAAKKKSPKAGAKKKKAVAKSPAKTPTKSPAKEPAKSKEDTKPPKKSKKDEEASTTTKPAPAKKPKAKKAVEKEDVKEDSDITKTKEAKVTKVTKEAKVTKVTKEAKVPKEAKAGKVSKSKATETISDDPAPRVTGKRGRKAAE